VLLRRYIEGLGPWRGYIPEGRSHPSFGTDLQNPKTRLNENLINSYNTKLVWIQRITFAVETNADTHTA